MYVIIYKCYVLGCFFVDLIVIFFLVCAAGNKQRISNYFIFQLVEFLHICNPVGAYSMLSAQMIASTNR